MNDLHTMLGMKEPVTEQEAKSLRVTMIALSFVLAMWVGFEVGSRIWP